MPTLQKLFGVVGFWRLPMPKRMPGGEAMSGIRQRLEEIIHAALLAQNGFPRDAGRVYMGSCRHVDPAAIAEALIESLGFTRETDGESTRWSTDWEA